MMPSKNNRFPTVAPLLLLVTFFFGCGAKESPPPAGPTKPAVGAGSPVQRRSSSTTVTVPQERRDFSGRKDPFRAYVVAPKAKLLLPQVTVRQLPIQLYEVNQFKVMGIITGLAENRAMVLDPAGKSFVVKVGGLIGPHNGRVVSIKPNAVEVVERYREENGRISNRVVKLTLPRKE